MNFVSLGSRCNPNAGEDYTPLGVVSHEILHAIGLYHEQERRDRSKVMAFPERRSAQLALGLTCRRREAKCSKGRRGDLHGPYDLTSIMHYSITEPRLEGIRLKDRGLGALDRVGGSVHDIGQRRALSEGDVAAVRFLYPAAGPKK